MPSPPLDSTHGRTMSGVALHYRHWTARMVGRRQAWYDITALAQHTRSNDVGRGMPSSPLGSTHGRTTLGMACHHLLWEAHTVERRWAWHDINAFEQHLWSNDVRHDMLSPLLDSTHDRKTSSVALHHRPWTACTVGRRRAWHDITALGQHTQSKDVKRGMKSPPLDNTHGRTTSGMTCHHRLWTAHTVERRWAWHTINAFGQHTRSNDVGRGMPSSPFCSTHGRTTSGVACHLRPLTA